MILYTIFLPTFKRQSLTKKHTKQSRMGIIDEKYLKYKLFGDKQIKLSNKILVLP